jgi:hypothetical protein
VRRASGQHEIATVQTAAIDQAAGVVNLTAIFAHASGVDCLGLAGLPHRRNGSTHLWCRTRARGRGSYGDLPALCVSTARLNAARPRLGSRHTAIFIAIGSPASIKLQVPTAPPTYFSDGAGLSLSAGALELCQIAHVSDLPTWKDFAIATRDATRETVMRLTFLDLAALTFVIMSVATGPLLVWFLFGMAAR